MTGVVNDALGGIRRSADGTWTVFGARFPALTRDHLANELYWTLHCRAPRDAPVPAPGSWGERATFLDRLSRANTGAGPWQAGWTRQRQLDHAHVVVRAFDVEFVAASRDVRAVRENGDPPEPQGSRALQADVAVEVRVPNEYRQFSSGYYTALGDRDHQPTTGPTIRVYWNVAPAGAAALVAELTNRLNAAGIPFRYKTPADSDRFARCDTGVLYLPAAAYRAVLLPLARVHCAILPHLRAPLSAFVKPIAYGLGAAFDPGDGTSFGWHRAGLLAGAILDAPGANAGAVAPTAVRTALARAGYDPRRLYLAPGARDILTRLAGSPGTLRRARSRGRSARGRR